MTSDNGIEAKVQEIVRESVEWVTEFQRDLKRSECTLR